MTRPLPGALVAIAFLTRVPVRVTVGGEHDVATAVPWFGPVGLLVGAVVGGTTAVASLVLDTGLAAGLGVAAGLLLTGAFHEDGLADTFDGLAGGYDRDRRLAIMRDSRLGTFGAAALVVALLLEVGAAGRLGADAPVWFVVGHGVSRVVATLVMLVSRPARADGLGAGRLTDVRRVPVLAGAVAVAGAGWALLPAVAPAGHVAVWGVPLLLALVLRAWSSRAVGGVTGDVLGAVQVCGLVGTLLVGTVVTA